MILLLETSCLSIRPFSTPSNANTHQSNTCVSMRIRFSEDDNGNDNNNEEGVGAEVELFGFVGQIFWICWGNLWIFQ